LNRQNALPNPDKLLADARQALAHNHLGNAQRAIERILALDPSHAEALFYLGNLLAGRRDVAGAIAAYEKALHAAPGNASVLLNLGVQYDEAGQLEQAEACYREVLSRSPRLIEALANLADLLFRQKRFEDALPAYDKLLMVAPGAPAEVWNNRGVCQKYSWKNAAAIESFHRALSLRPDSPEVLANLGFAEYERSHYEQARVLLARAHALDPARLQVRAHLLDLDLQFADWSDFDRKRDELVEAVARLGNQRGQTVAPFAFMSICDRPDLQLAAARSFAWPQEASAYSGGEAVLADIVAAPRLRLGFVSTVFHEHPVPRLIVDLLERLDRNRFEIFGYALGTGVADAMRSRIAGVTTAFREVAGMSALDIAEQIRADRIAVLFDIAGHTEYARPDVFAAKPAPVQINYLGQAGTLGATYYDYIGTDAFTSPPDEQVNFAERFWYLGECYFPCDPRRPIAHPPPARQHYGLPKDAFVFLSQAAAFKIVPSLFDVWMRLLADVAGSLLWLRPMRPLAQENLRLEAHRRGIDPQRLMFAPKEALPLYLARFRLADLYLDTHPFGSHTTVNDALFAGVPVITLAGRSVAARASASQLRAAGLSELVAATHEDYASIARSLARDEPRLRAITERLRTEGRSSSLFDMQSYTRRFEQALERIWRDYATHR